MVNLNLDITKYKSEHIDLLLTFWKTSRELGFVQSNSWEPTDWITDNLYYDDRGNILIKARWPEHYCKSTCFNKNTFIAWQLVGYQLKELMDSGEIVIDISERGNKYVPCWGPNKDYNIKQDTTRNRIKAAKVAWSKGKETWTVKCKTRGAHIESGFIRICCVCNRVPIMVLKNIRNV
jgi:hypothetical protein